MSNFLRELCRNGRFVVVNVLNMAGTSADEAAKFPNGATELPREPARPIPPSDAKLAALAASGTLNRNPQAVRDPWFRSGGFFDPRDLLQLRYEMLRRHRIENLSVAASAELFGLSLPTPYQAHAAFEAGGHGGAPARGGGAGGRPKITPAGAGAARQRRREPPHPRAD